PATVAPREQSSTTAPVRPVRAVSGRCAVGLAAIALVGLAVRLYFVLVGYRHYVLAGDSVYYHLQGWTFADGHWFVSPAGWFRNGVIGHHWTGHQPPTAYHPPLYGMYLGLVSWLGFWSVKAHRVASCFLGTAT